MSRPVTVFDPVVVCVAMPRKLKNHLLRVVTQESSRQRKPISMSEFIRELLLTAYPMQKDGKLFEERS